MINENNVLRGCRRHAAVPDYSLRSLDLFAEIRYPPQVISDK